MVLTPCSFTTYKHVSNICFGNHHPHVQDCYNYFSNMLRCGTAWFRNVKSVEDPQENRKTICTNYQRKFRRTDDPVESRRVTELSNVIPLGAAGQGEDVCA